MSTDSRARRPLNPATIVAAARRIADGEGIEALTLRRVAGELGTGQASLYRHIADRRQLLTLLADDLATGYPLVGAADTETAAVAVRQADTRTGEAVVRQANAGTEEAVVRRADAGTEEAVVRQWEAMRAYLTEHPWGARIIADGEHPLPSARPVTEHCVALLRATGLGEETALRAYRALWHLLLGHLLNAHPFGHIHGSGPEDQDFTWAVRRLLTGARTR